MVLNRIIIGTKIVSELYRFDKSYSEVVVTHATSERHQKPALNNLEAKAARHPPFICNACTAKKYLKKVFGCVLLGMSILLQ